MKVQVLGGGCARCTSLAANAAEAIEKSGVDATLEKVTDMDAIVDMGALVTPALAIDGTIHRPGKILSVEEITTLLTRA